MKGLETGKEKIQKICDALKKETLEPAQQEARELIENARLQAAGIVAEAKKKGEELLEGAQKEMEERQKVFQASLSLACRQGIELFKQKIEADLFDKELVELVAKEMGNPKVIAEILETFLRSMEEKGIEEDFTATIPKKISPRSVTALLTAQMLEKLRDRPLALGGFLGGIQIHLKGRRITIDISDTVVREIIAQYIRRDFRELVFNI